MDKNDIETHFLFFCQRCVLCKHDTLHNVSSLRRLRPLEQFFLRSSDFLKTEGKLIYDNFCLQRETIKSREMYVDPLVFNVRCVLESQSDDSSV